MKTSDFNYDLPEELIAQEPVEPRDSSRLLVVSKGGSQPYNSVFHNIIELLHKGDRLIFNDTKVLQARVMASKPTGARVEILFTTQIDNKRWFAMVKPGKRLKVGTLVIVDGVNAPSLIVDNIVETGERIIRLVDSKDYRSITDVMEKFGAVPLPPYITRKTTLTDSLRYQTVYAEKSGAIAAPTAGLHFTQNLMDKLKAKGVDMSYVTLHVGAGTFKPVKEDNPKDHPMHSERYYLNSKTVSEIEETKKNGGRNIAVGTTVVRVLEHCAKEYGKLTESSGETKLMILPPYEFKVIDGLITNFHLPQSTLLMLTCAFAGTSKMLNAYKFAVDNKYRFYSYGDAMVILPD